jgi:hypothetical protein
MKCRYKYCKLGGEVDKQVALKIGGAYYHNECYKEMENKKKIRDLWLEKINSTEIMTLLNKEISELINKKGIDSDFLLYALNYAINNKIILHSPFGMSYLINNYKIKESYKNIQAKQKLKEIQKYDTENKKETTFSFDIENKNLMDRIRK